MIIDKIENLEMYRGLNPLLDDVIRFIKEHDLKSLENGKHFIKDGHLFVNIQDAQGKTRDEAVIEYHKKMIDIQIPLNMPETYGYTPVADLPETEFNTDKDIAKVPGVQARSYVTANPGEFAMFFPQDGHAPCIADGLLHKAIFKVED
jgi:YhcH/YjgK/YiaL family protein